MKIDLHLARSALMIRRLRLQPHLSQGHAQLAPDVFSFILRRHIHITGLIERSGRASAGFVKQEQIKLKLGREIKIHILIGRRFHRVLEHAPAVERMHRLILIEQIADHADDAAIH